MGRLVRDDKKKTVSQITTCYNQGMQNTISECTAHRTLKQMSYGSRRPHRMPLLSAKNRERRLQFTQPHQNWTIEDWKNIAWSDESQFLLQYSDGRVRIWRKEHESMDPSCLVSTVQAAGGGVMVWGIFSWHTLGPLVPIGQAHMWKRAWRQRHPRCQGGAGRAGVDSVGSRDGVDSVGSRNGGDSGADSTLKAEPLRCRARLTYSSSDSSVAQYGIMDLKGSARPLQNLTMRQVFSVSDWRAIPTISSA